ncbi:hypothetical protein ACFO25_08975 [Paenactinomyces guangxiensis]|uniref:Uncharacterized protein n=1 Tax=Paenactinomyces guangxiensis TaxID=1490290 RepID=A0A7W1WN28_9BACL|nr:hypothetical protein [Paenactinomyces guangxiensis]MBA4492821.1 hypothetical protein [Paenactinomyces guangxiensis]MBH8590330.1 hypothetical protein [Paenactinomyces guangxiensis]
MEQVGRNFFVCKTGNEVENPTSTIFDAVFGSFAPFRCQFGTMAEALPLFPFKAISAKKTGVIAELSHVYFFRRLFRPAKNDLDPEDRS